MEMMKVERLVVLKVDQWDDRSAEMLVVQLE
jgi:hypothetical protein